MFIPVQHCEAGGSDDITGGIGLSVWGFRDWGLGFRVWG